MVGGGSGWESVRRSPPERAEKPADDRKHWGCEAGEGTGPARSHHGRWQKKGQGCQ